MTDNNGADEGKQKTRLGESAQGARQMLYALTGIIQRLIAIYREFGWAGFFAVVSALIACMCRCGCRSSRVRAPNLFHRLPVSICVDVDSGAAVSGHDMDATSNGDVEIRHTDNGALVTRVP